MNTPLDFGAIGDKMKVSELSEYQEKTEKTGIRVWDRLLRINWGEYIIVPEKPGEDKYLAVSIDNRSRWGVAVAMPGAISRNFTKSELEQILGSLNDWEVVE